MFIAIIPLVAFIVGVLIYVLASNAKAVEIGRALIWTGLLVTLWISASHTIRL